DDRHLRPGSQPFHDGRAVHVRQPQVQDYEIDGLERRCSNALACSGGVADREALKLESRAQEAPDLRFVVDYQNRWRLIAHGRAAPRLLAACLIILAEPMQPRVRWR